MRQGCSLSPVLVNAYIKHTIDEFNETTDEGIKIQGEKITMLRYADDIALRAESKEDLKQALKKMNHTLKNYNMPINENKTKVLVVKQ